MKAALAPIFIVMLVGISTDADALPHGACIWVDGRLSAYNGNPTFRIWPKGSRRLLGIVSPSGAPDGSDFFPPKLSKMTPSFDRDIWGSFRLCPQTPDRPGWMRMVVVVDARGLTARAR